MTSGQVDKNARFDKLQKLIPLVERLYRALDFSTKKVSSQSTNLAQEVIDTDNHKILFLRKLSNLSENLGIPLSGGGVREILYYLLDHDNFAGVPPCINIKEGESNRCNYVYYKKDCKEWRHETKALIPGLRKVFIHQFRTVNMDPTTPNILIKKTKDGKKVFPIDGGYILPTTMKYKAQFFEVAGEPKDSLKNQPFLDQPFTQEEFAYIQNLNIQKDCKLIQKYLQGISSVPSDILDTLKIFTLANRLLKRAVEKYDPNASDFISLYDLCCFIDIKESPEGGRNDERNSLFEDLLKCKVENLGNEIDKLFDQIILIKSLIRESKDTNHEEMAINIIEKMKIHDTKLKAIVVIYILGGRRYFEYMFMATSMTKKEVKDDFNMRLYNNLKN